MSLPTWLRRNPVFRFLASLHLALILLAVIILASIVGTIYESRLTAEVARAYIYQAWWFDLWLLFLVLNLAAVAFSRLPWKKAHTGFLLTHLGIITLLIGAYIGKTFGIEGSVTLFKGQAPVNQLLINQKELRLSLNNGTIHRLPASILNRQPSEKHPLKIGHFQGWDLSAIGFSENLEPVFTPEAVDVKTDDSHPALRFKLNTALMGQTMENWLWLGDEDQSVVDLGLARIRLLAGVAPAVKSKNTTSTSSSSTQSKTGPVSTGLVEIQENIFVFAKLPDQQIGKVLRGNTSSLKIKLREDSGTLRLDVSLGDKNWKFETPSSNTARSWPLPGTRLKLNLKEYWPDFQLQDNKPVSLSPNPLNPAILVEISGQAPTVAAPTASGDNPHQTPGGPVAIPAPGEESPNRLDVYVAPDGSLTYHLFSRKQGESRGKLDPAQALATGWADWTFKVGKFLPQAEARTFFQPAKTDDSHSHGPAETKTSQGLLVRMRQGETVIDEWVPQGWLIQTPTKAGLIRMSYGWKTAPLPFAIQLADFQVTRYPGSTNPSEFRSTLTILDTQGGTATGSCSMNQPMNYPSEWWRGWTGLTYKMSQASWNPENLNQSSIQILRDPGWFLKWVGSLILCIGIFTLFYLRPMKGELRPPPKL